MKYFTHLQGQVDQNRFLR